MYQQLISQHLHEGQVWGVAFKANQDWHKKCECIEEEATREIPYCGDVVTEVKTQRYRYFDTGDGALFTGHALAMIAYKLATTHDPAVFADLETVLAGIEKLFAVTGSAGLLARAFTKNSKIQLDGESIVKVGAGRYAGYSWSGDVSQDQYSGVMFGLWSAWNLVENESIRDRIETLVTDVVDVLIQSNQVIPRESGYSDLSFSPGIADSGNAIFLISYILMAAEMTGKSKYKNYFEKITQKDSALDITALSIAKLWGTIDPSLTSACHYREKTEDSYYRFNILAPWIYFLNAMSSKWGFSSEWSDVRSVFWSGFSEGFVNWPGVKNDKNAFFDQLYLLSGLSGGHYDYQKVSGHDSYSEEAAQDALRQLAGYPAGLRRKNRVLNTDEEEPGCEGTAKKALDVERRGAVDYAWQISPYTISQPCHQPWVEFPGVDYLLAYWMARYHGYYRKPSVSVSTPVVPQIKSTLI